MAIDTKAKRHSALGQRFGRLPFGRRFTQPPPDSTIDQGDRQTVAFCYGGVLAGAAVNPSEGTPEMTFTARVRGHSFSARPRGHVFSERDR